MTLGEQDIDAFLVVLALYMRSNVSVGKKVLHLMPYLGS